MKHRFANPQQTGLAGDRADDPPDEQHLPLHADLIYLAHEFANGKTRGRCFEKVLAADNEYFSSSTPRAPGTTATRPPHVHHEHRRSAAQWALDSK